MGDIDITRGGRSSAGKLTPGTPDDQSDRTDPISGGGGDVPFDRDYTPQVGPIPGPAIDWSVIVNPDHGKDSGQGGEPIPPPVEPDYNPGVEYVISTWIEEVIDDFSSEAIQRYIDEGGTAVAIYDDGTEAVLDWGNVQSTIVVRESVSFDWSYADDQISDVRDDIAQFKETANRTYSTKTELDEETGSLRREVAVTYATKAENEASTHPNLSPFFAHDLNDYANFINNTIDAPWTNNDAYFLIKRPSGGFDVDIDNYSLDVTQLDDGWANVYMQNKKTTAQRFDFYIADPLDLKEDSEYTFLIEIRNNNSSISTAGNNFYIVQNGENYGQNCWFWGAGITALLEGTGATGGVNLQDECPPGTTGVYRKRFVKKTEKTGSTRWKGTHIRTLVSLVFLLRSQEVLNFDIRVSMYEGRYLGIYKPYVVPDSKLATKSYVSQTAESIEAGVETRFSDVQTTFDEIDAALDNMQDQIDGRITTWYGTVTPTTSNYPASSWTTEAAKASHNGDLYFNSDTGDAWRWLETDGVWGWVSIPASEAQQALEKAQQALDELVEVRRDYLTKAEQTITDNAIRQSVAENLETAKTYASGLVDNEVAARNAAITTESTNIKMEVSQEYAKKTVANPNLSPFFSHGAPEDGSNTDDYWLDLKPANLSTFVSVDWHIDEDGWIDITWDRTGKSGGNYFHTMVKPDPKLKTSSKYTILTEIAELTVDAGTPGIMVVYSAAQCQFDRSKTTNGVLRHTEGTLTIGSHYSVTETRASFDGCTHLNRGYLECPAGSKGHIRYRISLYDGEYEGPYKPYVLDPYIINDKYATKAELTVEADRISSSVAEIREGQPGGANILRNTNIDGHYVGTGTANWADGNWNIRSGGNGTGEVFEIATPPEGGITHGFRISNNTTGNRDLGQNNIPVSPGTVYTMGCWARLADGASSGTLQMRLYWSGTVGYKNSALTADWVWYSFSQEIPAGYTSVLAIFGVKNAGAGIEMCGFSLIRESSYTKELSTTVTQTATDVQTAITQSATAIETANNSVQTVSVEYARNQSSTTAPTSGWSTASPVWADGYYIWSRTKTTSPSGTVTSNPVCITGAKGADGTPGSAGATGKGVSSIVEEYYLSTSSTTQSGGSWSTAQPVWAANKYIWTRSKITWSDNTTTTTTPVLAKAINGANTAASEAKTTATSISTVIRQYGQGVLVSKTSETIGALLNANASFDIVPVSWSGTTPTADTTTNNKLATFGALSFTIGKPTGKNLSGTINGIYLKDGGSNLAFVTPTTAQLGKDDQKNVQLTTGGLYLRDASTNLAAFTPTSVTLGKSDNYNVNLSAGTTGAGLYLRNGTNNLAQFTTTAITLGTLGTSTDPKKNIVINENGIYLRYYSNAYASFTTDSITLGLTSSGQSNVVLTSNGAQLRSGTTVLAKYASDEITIGSTSGRHILIDSTTLKLKDGTAELSSWKSSEIRIGKTGTSNRNVLIDSNGLSIRDNTTVLSSFKSGEVIIGQVAASQRNVLIDSSGLSIRENTTVLASFKSGEVIIGQVAASKRNVIINSSGLTIRENTTSLASFTSTQISLGSESPFTITRKLFTIKTPSSSGTGSGSVSTTRYITNLSVPESGNKNALAFSAGTTEIRLDSDGIYETNRITGARAFITPTVPDDVAPDVTNTKTWPLSMETTSSNVFSLTNGTTVNIKKPGTYIVRLWWWDKVSGEYGNFDIKCRSSSTVYMHHYGSTWPLYAGAHLKKFTVSVKDGDTLQFYIQTVTKGLNFTMADMDIIRCTDYK